MSAKREPGRDPLRRPSIREEHKAATFDSLLDSAWELFIEQGYDRTTVEQITARARTSRATFYLHFEKKLSAVVALLEECIVPETLGYYDVLESYGRPSREQLRAWLDSALDFYTRHSTELGVMESASQSEPELAAIGFSVTERAAERLPTFLGSLGPDGRSEARTRVILLILQLSQFASLSARGRLHIDRDTALSVLVDLWAAGLCLDGDVSINHHPGSPAAHA